MSRFQRRAARKNGPTGPEGAHLKVYMRVLRVVGDRRELVWGSMVYQCTGSRSQRMKLHDMLRAAKTKEEARALFGPGKGSGCGYERRVYLGVGVEGPDNLRENGAIVPSPANAGMCPECGGGMAHVRWDEDESFEPTTTDKFARPFAVFVVPTAKRAAELAGRAYGGAELIEVTQ